MGSKSLHVRLGVFLAFFAIAGCGSGGSTTVTPPPKPAASAVSPDYVIGPGDSLSVFVRNNPDLSTSVAIRPDGKISIPLVNDMQAVGKTPSQLAKDVETVLAEFVRTPDVTIMVAGFGVGAFDNQIRVVGAGAVKPQSIPYRDGLTLLDVMIEAGMSQFAAGDRAKLVRRNGSGVQEIPVHLNRLVNRGDLTQNYALQPGDVVIIPQTRF